MAGLFKTGQELRDEQMQALAASNLQTVGSGSKTTLGRGVSQLGSALGAALAAKLGGEADPAAGDVDISSADLGTSKGNFDAAKAMRAQGFEEEAQKLEDRGIKLASYERVAAAEQDAAGDYEDVPEPTDNQLSGINNYWAMRTDATGELALQIMEDSVDNPVAAAGLKHMNRMIAVNTNEMVRDLVKVHGERVPRTMIERAMVDTLAEGGMLGEKGFLFWKDPVVNVKEAEKTMQQVRDKVMDMFTKGTAEDAPVETAPAQQTTQMPDAEAEALGQPPSEAPAETLEVPGVSEVGEPIPATPDTGMTPLEDDLKMTRLDYANELKEIDKRLKEVTKRATGKKAAQLVLDLQKRRAELIQQLSRTQ